MSNFNAGYNAKTFPTWGGMMLVGLTVQAVPYISCIDGLLADSGTNVHIQADNIKSTVDGVNVKPLSNVNAEVVFSVASQNFISELSAAQEPLGYQFAKVIEDNFFDLLA